MVNELIVSLGHTTVAASLAAMLVLAVRLPLRRICGCGVAYAAWLAVPLTALATLLPRPAFQVPALGMMTITHLVIDTPPGIAARSATWDWQAVVAFVWACGAIGMALRQAAAQRAYVRSLGPLTTDGRIAISRSPAAGPSLLGLWKPVIAIPLDFDQRYTPVQRELILAHERAHAEARDPLVNLLCAVCLCLWWFNPLMHVAVRLLREDQELARDADVMRAFPGNRRAYADAMLKTQLSLPRHSAIACRWEPKHPLKERMMNLSRTPTNAARLAGRMLLAVGLLLGAYAAWAEQGAASRALPGVDGERPTPVVTAPVRSFSDWEHARPSSTVTVAPGPKPGLFVVRARVTDLETGQVLIEPRVLTRAGFPATIESGTDKVLVRFVVTVNPSGKEASYTNEIVRDGRVESSQSAILVVDPTGVSEATRTPSSEAALSGGLDSRPYEIKLIFISSSQTELSCVADVFAAEGRADLAEAMRASWNGERHEAAFSTIAATHPPEADQLMASLSKCRLGVDSKLTWSVGKRPV